MTHQSESLVNQPENAQGLDEAIVQKLSSSTGGLRKAKNGEYAPKYSLRREKMYDRSADDYSDIINADFGERGPNFNLKDWRGKRLLDLGSGGYESFGLEARKEGVDVISVNPSLVMQAHRDVLLNYNRARKEVGSDRPMRQAFMRGIRTVLKDIKPGSMTVAAIGQELPFKSELFDSVVSVFAVPQYLYDSGEMGYGTGDKEKLRDYTPERRQRTVVEMTKAFAEIVRVLKPGGAAYLVDSHRHPDQLTGIATYSAGDGSEAIEVLDSIKGFTFEIFEHEEVMEDGSGGTADKRSTIRTIVIHKHVSEND